MFIHSIELYHTYLNVSIGKMTIGAASLYRHFCSSRSSFYDIVIVGGGLVGSAMACSIGKSNHLASKRVLLIDSAKKTLHSSKRLTEFSNRVSAVNPSSIELFKKLEIWDAIKTRAQSVFALNVEDGCTGARISFERLNHDFPIAYIAENEQIIQAFHTCFTENCPNVDYMQDTTYTNLSIPMNRCDNILMELNNAQTVETSLVIAADGINSRSREISGIEYSKEDYNQTAIVATLEISTKTGQNNFAWQRFMPLGPIAILPLNDKLSSMVWTTSSSEAKRLLDLPKELFIDQLNYTLFDTSAQNPLLNRPLDSLSALLNTIPILKHSSTFTFPSVLALPHDDRAAFPLSYIYAKDYIVNRLALIGDAAHRIHPLAGQGVNLGWSDVRSLTNNLETTVKEGGDIGSITYLKGYDSEIQKLNIPIMTTIHCLNHLFSTDSIPYAFFRSVGFTFLDRLHPAKDLIVQIAS